MKADDGGRTRDLRLGKPTLYQLSYVRVERRILAPALTLDDEQLPGVRPHHAVGREVDALLEASRGFSVSGPNSPSAAIPTCGATSTPAGTLTVGVGSSLAQLQPDGAPNDRFARGGLIRIARPRGVGVNAVSSSGSRRVVLAGSAGNAAYVARYRLPPPR